MAAVWLDFFRKEVSVDNASERAETIRRGVKLIAAAVGPIETRNGLLPILVGVSSRARGERDEVLHALATEFGSLVDFVGGDEHLHVLVPPLEELSAQEETVVREAAIKSIHRVVTKVRTSQRQQLVVTHVYPVYTRLLKGDWFTCKVSACGLAPLIYAHLPPNLQNEMRLTFLQLCRDEAPMVRRAATYNLQNLFRAMDRQHIFSHMTDICDRLWKEPLHEEVRCSVLLATIALSRKCDGPQNETYTLSIITDAAEDRSWKVRRTLAEHFDELMAAYGRELTTTHLLEPFAALLKDSESSVRTLCIEVLGRSLQYLTASQLSNTLVPTFPALAADTAQPVRAALATLLGPVVALLGREETQKSLYKLIMDLMNDKVHEVRLNLVCQAGQICEVLCFSAVAHPLLTTMQSLITDPQWRIRLSVINQIPRLAKQFGPEIFQTRFESMYLSALCDTVFSVRECAIENIAVIAGQFGAQWTIESLIPKVLKRYDFKPDANGAVGAGSEGAPQTSEAEQSSYIERISVIHSLMPLSSVLSTDQVEAKILPLLLRALDDDVSNVRFAATRVISQMAEARLLSQKAFTTIIEPRLTAMTMDNDVDVMFFAGEALKAVRAK